MRRILKNVVKVGAAAAVAATALLASPAAVHADDTYLFALGGGGESDWPPSVTFVFDTSGSMNNLICRDMPSSAGGDCTNSSHWYTMQAPNGASICANDVFFFLTGPDQDGDGIRDPYNGTFASDGLAYEGPHYQVLAFRTAGDRDDWHASYIVYNHDSIHSWNNPTFM